MSKYSEYWDNVVRPLAEEVFEFENEDSEMMRFFISKMIWAVEHDLADGREMGVGSIQSLSVVRGTFGDDSYYKKIHGNTKPEQVNKMKELSNCIDELVYYGC